MKKALFFCLLAGISLISNKSFGADCKVVTCNGNETRDSVLVQNCVMSGSDSNVSNWTCYTSPTGTARYYAVNCLQCASGYKLAYGTGQRSGYLSCTIPMKTCVLDSGGGIDEPTCPGNCPAEDEWVSATGNREARCNTASTPDSNNYYKCTYRCKAGYYNSSALVGQVSCSVCPDHATCAAGLAPKCDRGYFLESVSSGGGLISGAKKCTDCPWYNDAGNFQMRQGQTVSTGSTSITQCYEPKGVDHMDDTGLYEITTDQKCFYVK